MATQLIRDHSVVEVQSKWNRARDIMPDTIVLPESRTLTDFVIDPCKHEGNLMKQIRHARQASAFYNNMDPVRHALPRATVGQYGRDMAHCSLKTVRALERVPKVVPS